MSEIRYGFCECGCGQRTTIAARNSATRGIVKGEPLRFIRFHHVSTHRTGGVSYVPLHGRWFIHGRNGGHMYAYARGLMQGELGRHLAPDEIVHHINGDPTDDRIENLQVLSRSEHTRLHNDLRRKAQLDLALLDAERRLESGDRNDGVRAVCRAIFLAATQKHKLSELELLRWTNRLFSAGCLPIPGDEAA